MQFKFTVIIFLLTKLNNESWHVYILILVCIIWKNYIIIIIVINKYLLFSLSVSIHVPYYIFFPTSSVLLLLEGSSRGQVLGTTIVYEFNIYNE